VTATEKTKLAGCRISEQKWLAFKQALLSNGRTMQWMLEHHIDLYIEKFGPK
jgi:hypothetical protein